MKKRKKGVSKLLRSEPFRLIGGLALFIPAFILERVGLSVLSLVLYISALVLSGGAVFFDAVRGIVRKDFLDEKFLMSIASVGAMIIGEAEEGVAVMLFYILGEWFEHIAVRRSRSSIRSLLDIRPDSAVVLSDGEEVLTDADDVEMGSLIVIRSGERVALDCVVVEGGCDLDTSALTGESVPVGVSVGDELLSGAIVASGVVTCRTLRTADNSCAARILDLVENAQERKSRSESFITRFSRVYTPIVTSLALLMAVLPTIFGWLSLSESVYRALSFLVVSCPCALVISVPMAYFGGIGGAAASGVLYKGGNVFAPIGRARTVVFDKTGTLTKGTLSVSGVVTKDIDEDELLALAASVEYTSRHPIAECIKAAAKKTYPVVLPSELAGRGVLGYIDGKSVAVGNLRYMHSMYVNPPVTDAGVYVAVEGRFAGAIYLSDTIKDEAGDAISSLRRLGVSRVVMLSGDRMATAREVGNTLGFDEVHAELLPTGKVERLEKIIKESDGGVIYVGDGINDAPCLARADVGVAMGSLGSDSAIEAADAVIMSDNLLRLSDAIRIARKTERIAKENIIFAIGIKLAILALVSINLAGMWLAVFADVGVAVLAILNSTRTLIGRRKRKK